MIKLTVNVQTKYKLLCYQHIKRDKTKQIIFIINQYAASALCKDPKLQSRDIKLNEAKQNLRNSRFTMNIRECLPGSSSINCTSSSCSKEQVIANNTMKIRYLAPVRRRSIQQHNCVSDILSIPQYLSIVPQVHLTSMDCMVFTQTKNKVKVQVRM